MHVPAEVLPVVWLDGAYVFSESARVSVFDRGFLMADGAFETMHVKAGAILGLDAHAVWLWRAADFFPPNVQFPKSCEAEVIFPLCSGS